MKFTAIAKPVFVRLSFKPSASKLELYRRCACLLMAQCGCLYAELIGDVRALRQLMALTRPRHNPRIGVVITGKFSSVSVYPYGYNVLLTLRSNIYTVTLLKDTRTD
jgi:hypothetical protein